MKKRRYFYIVANVRTQALVGNFYLFADGVNMPPLHILQKAVADKYMEKNGLATQAFPPTAVVITNIQEFSKKDYLALQRK